MEMENKRKEPDLIEANRRLNAYVAEEIIFGQIKSGEKLDLEKCIIKVSLRSMKKLLDYAGVAIDYRGRARENTEELFRYCFNFWFSSVFAQMDKKVKYNYADDGMITEFSDEMLRYAGECFELFKEIWNTEVEYDEFDLKLPYLECDRIGDCRKFAEIFAKIKIQYEKRKIDIGSYIKRVYSVPYCVKRLLNKAQSYCWIMCDPESVDYKLALFSLFPLRENSNAKLLELKIRRWLELQGE